MGLKLKRLLFLDWNAISSNWHTGHTGIFFGGFAYVPVCLLCLMTHTSCKAHSCEWFYCCARSLVYSSRGKACRVPARILLHASPIPLACACMLAAARSSISLRCLQLASAPFVASSE